MPSPPLKKFCFCANLEVGCAVVGYLQAVYYVITLIGALILLILRPDNYKKEAKDVLMPIIIFRIIGIAASVFLIVGSRKRNKSFLLPYLILEGIGFVLLVLLCLYTIPDKRSEAGRIGIFLLEILYLGLNTYFWLVVLSMYLTLSNGHRQQPNTMIPLQTIPENQRMYIPANNTYPQQQQQPLYIPQPINAYPQQQMNPSRDPPAYPVQNYHQAPLPEKV